MRRPIFVIALLVTVATTLAGCTVGRGSATAPPFQSPTCTSNGQFQCHSSSPTPGRAHIPSAAAATTSPRPAPAGTGSSLDPAMTSPNATTAGPAPTGSNPGQDPAMTSQNATTAGPGSGPAAAAPGAWQCVTSAPSGNCGAYDYPRIVSSNGYNTYIGNNCWADPSCSQTVSANSPGDWQVRADEPAGNTAVKTYPDVQQLFNNWTGSGWGPCGACTDTPLNSLTSLTSSYAESTPHNAATIAQFAWDIWMDNNAGFPDEVMVWVDNSNRGSGGARQVGSATIGGQAWTAYEYGTGEFIWSLGAPGTFAQQPAGTVNLLALLRWMQGHGFMAASPVITQIDAGWGICSTGGGPETFRVSSYSATAR